MKAFETITGPKEGETFSAASFLTYMRKSAPHWWEDDDKTSDCAWVFRGQANSDWKLIPSAGRPKLQEGNNAQKQFRNIIDALDKQMFAKYPRWKTLAPIIRDQILRYWANKLSVKGFMTLARELNFKLDTPLQLKISLLQWVEKLPPDTAGILWAIDNLLSGDYLPPVSELVRINVSNHSVALAQHHGVPTFLLDWTENPIVACHFATNKPDDSMGKTTIAVWALNCRLLENELLSNLLSIHTTNIRIRVIRPPKSGNQFLSSQSGILTTLRNPELVWTTNEEYPDLQSVIESYDIGDPEEHNGVLGPLNNFDTEKNSAISELLASDRTLLRKIILPYNQYAELQKLLLREGISKAHMMPTLDNIASTSLAHLVSEMVS